MFDTGDLAGARSTPTGELTSFPASKTKFTFVGIVRSASQGDVARAGGATAREGNNVMKLEPVGFGTSPMRTDEGAPATVSVPDGTPNGRRQIARS